MKSKKRIIFILVQAPAVDLNSLELFLTPGGNSRETSQFYVYVSFFFFLACLSNLPLFVCQRDRGKFQGAAARTLIFLQMAS